MHCCVRTTDGVFTATFAPRSLTPTLPQGEKEECPSLAPLLLARHAVIVAVHLGAGTVLQEERRLLAGRHLRHRAAIAAEPGWRVVLVDLHRRGHGLRPARPFAAVVTVGNQAMPATMASVISSCTPRPPPRFRTRPGLRRAACESLARSASSPSASISWRRTSLEHLRACSPAACARVPPARTHMPATAASARCNPAPATPRPPAHR